MYRQYKPEVLKRLQQEELGVLKEIIRVCEKHNITYFALFGTAIGAVRHKGFIPWDDDIDIGMLRKDYEHFLKVAPKEFKGKYKISGPDTKEKYYNLIPNVSKVGTRLCTQYDHGRYHVGILVDIFPYDGLAEDKKDRKRQIACTSFWRRLNMVRNVNFFTNSVSKKGNFIPRLASLIAHCLAQAVPGTFIYRQYLKHATAYNGRSSMVTQLCDSGTMESVLSIDELLPVKKIPFEDFELCVPKANEKILSQMYGDYMQMPPPEKRQNHYPYLLDFGDDREE